MGQTDWLTTAHRMQREQPINMSKVAVLLKRSADGKPIKNTLYRDRIIVNTDVTFIFNPYSLPKNERHRGSVFVDTSFGGKDRHFGRVSHLYRIMNVTIVHRSDAGTTEPTYEQDAEYYYMQVVKRASLPTSTPNTCTMFYRQGEKAEIRNENESTYKLGRTAVIESTISDGTIIREGNSST